MSKKVILCFFQTIEDIPCHWCKGTGKETRRVGFWGKLKKVECFSCKGTGILKDYPTQYDRQLHLNADHPEVKVFFDDVLKVRDQEEEERKIAERKAKFKVVQGGEG